VGSFGFSSDAASRFCESRRSCAALARRSTSQCGFWCSYCAGVFATAAKGGGGGVSMPDRFMAGAVDAAAAGELAALKT